MARRKSPTLTDLELVIMQHIWREDETTVDALVAALAEDQRPLTPQSIRTMLAILGDKGYVARRRLGRGHAYRAAVPPEQAEKRILNDVVDRVFSGSASSLPRSLSSSSLPEHKVSTGKSFSRTCSAAAPRRGAPYADWMPR